MVFNPQGSVRLDAPCAPQKLDATPVLRQDAVRLNPFRISNIKKRKPSPIESGEPNVTMLHSRQRRRIEFLPSTVFTRVLHTRNLFGLLSSRKTRSSHVPLSTTAGLRTSNLGQRNRWVRASVIELTGLPTPTIADCAPIVRMDKSREGAGITSASNFRYSWRKGAKVFIGCRITIT